MDTIELNPYIFFKGNCRDAMGFYKDVFGGELSIQTYEDVGQPQAELENAVMHAALTGGDASLMGSDTTKASEAAAKISLSLMGSDEDKLRKIFARLSEGGKVFSELKTEFWGDTFGSLTDQYGVDWMINITAPKNA